MLFLFDLNLIFSISTFYFKNFVQKMVANRLLETKVGPVFEDRGEFFKVVIMDRAAWFAIKFNPFGRYVISLSVRFARGKKSSPRSCRLTMPTGPGKMKKTKCLTLLFSDDGVAAYVALY